MSFHLQVNVFVLVLFAQFYVHAVIFELLTLHFSQKLVVGDKVHVELALVHVVVTAKERKCTRGSGRKRTE